jgi:hypothetical protein
MGIMRDFTVLGWNESTISLRFPSILSGFFRLEVP